MKPESPDQPRCPRCEGTGWDVAAGEDGIRRARKCGTCDYWDLRRGYAPGVPTDLQNVTLDSYGTDLESPDRMKGPLEQARYFVDGVHPGLFIYGGVGCGKTTLAAAILNMVHRQRVRVLFARVPELLLRLQSGAGEESSQLFERVAGVQVLCLDDVGADKGSDYSRRMLQTVFDARQDRAYRTIWTSNLDLDELAVFLADERLPSRIAGAAKLVEMDGPDYRLKQAKKRLKGAK